MDEKGLAGRIGRFLTAHTTWIHPRTGARVSRGGRILPGMIPLSRWHAMMREIMPARLDRIDKRRQVKLGKPIRSQVEGSGSQWWRAEIGKAKTVKLRGLSQTGWRYEVVPKDQGFAWTIGAQQIEPGKKNILVDGGVAPTIEAAQEAAERAAMAMDAKGHHGLPAHTTVAGTVFDRINETDMVTMPVPGVKVIVRFNLGSKTWHTYAQVGDERPVEVTDYTFSLKDALDLGRVLAAKLAEGNVDYRALTTRAPSGGTWRAYDAGQRGLGWSGAEGMMHGPSDEAGRALAVLHDAKDLGVKILGPADDPKAAQLDNQSAAAVFQMLWAYHAMYPGFPRLIKTMRASLEGPTKHKDTIAYNAWFPSDPGKFHITINPQLWTGQVRQKYDAAADEWVDISHTEKVPDEVQTRFVMAREARGEATAEKVDEGWFSGRWDEEVAQAPDDPEWKHALIHVLHHEFGHSVAEVGFFLADPQTKDAMYQLLEGWGVGKKVGKTFVFDKDRLAVLLSRYGATSLHEMFAEIWAEYMNDPEPRGFVKQVGDLLGKGLNKWLIAKGLSGDIEYKFRGTMNGVESKAIPGRRFVRSRNKWFVAGRALPEGAPIPEGAMRSPGHPKPGTTVVGPRTQAARMPTHVVQEQYDELRDAMGLQGEQHHREAGSPLEDLFYGLIDPAQGHRLQPWTGEQQSHMQLHRELDAYDTETSRRGGWGSAEQRDWDNIRPGLDKFNQDLNWYLASEATDEEKERNFPEIHALIQRIGDKPEEWGELSEIPEMDAYMARKYGITPERRDDLMERFQKEKIRKRDKLARQLFGPGGLSSYDPKNPEHQKMYDTLVQQMVDESREGYKKKSDVLDGLEVKQALHGRVAGKAAYLVERKVDAQTAKTGAMIALLPAKDQAEKLVIPGGELPEELHITLNYLGKAADWSPIDQSKVVDAALRVARKYGPMWLKAFSASVFNPRTANACLVLGCGGPNLADLRNDVCDGVKRTGHDCPPNHTPWVPHMTLAYVKDQDISGLRAAMERTGPVLFDRIGVFFGGVIHELPLTGDIQTDKNMAETGRECKSFHRLLVEQTESISTYLNHRDLMLFKRELGIDPMEPLEAKLSGFLDIVTTNLIPNQRQIGSNASD